MAGTSTRAAAAAFARKWLNAATDPEIADLHVGWPPIPRPLDIELIASVEQTLNRPLHDDDTTRRDARSAFWGVQASSCGITRRRDPAQGLRTPRAAMAADPMVRAMAVSSALTVAPNAGSARAQPREASIA